MTAPFTPVPDPAMEVMCGCTFLGPDPVLICANHHRQDVREAEQADRSSSAERAAMIPEIEWALFGSEDGDLIADDSEIPVGELRRLLREEWAHGARPDALSGDYAEAVQWFRAHPAGLKALDQPGGWAGWSHAANVIRAALAAEPVRPPHGTISCGLIESFGDALAGSAGAVIDLVRKWHDGAFGEDVAVAVNQLRRDLHNWRLIGTPVTPQPPTHEPSGE